MSDRYKPADTIQLHEFGRNVQQMVARLKAEPDRDRRNILANEVIRVMATVVPASREITDFRKRLWECLFAIAGYDLDVDAPVEVRTKPSNASQIKRLPYYSPKSQFPQYGKNLELLIQQAAEMQPGPEREAFVLKLAQLMKQYLMNADSANPSDTVIFKHLAELSGGRILLNPEDVSVKTGVFGQRNAFALPNMERFKVKKKKKKKRKKARPSGY